MRRRLVPLIALLALGALALPAGAPAKDVRSATVCGPDGCATTRDRAALRTLLEGNAPGAPPAARAPFFTVRFRMGPEGSYVVRWLPAEGLVRSEVDAGDPTWTRPDPAGLALLRKVADGLRPFPARELGPLRPRPQGGSLAPDVVEPAARTGGHGGGPPAAAWAGVAAALLAVVLVLLGRRRRRRRAIAAGLTVLALGALPAAAGAKELSSADLCAGTRCVTVRDRATVEALDDASMPTGPPAVAGARYRLRFHVTHEGEDVGWIDAAWLPQAGVVEHAGEAGGPRYYQPSFPARVALDRLTAELRAAPVAARRPPAGASGGGLPWAAIAAGTALLAAAAAVLGRRRPRLAR